ncbi:O-antigen chain-terminating methyltransferase [Candidatus Hakubella thermalkaliphila]|uniref:O-antigen chain-terminating methyltransferase n=1 Tax=Candidatus Hakubella thermalkaliphila TaxID=2754717 RepID=A0A6V8NXT4_9ACTN|nr:putative S-adenosyl-L-methionine-dependent methyltransferase TehB [Bacillota bacterium]GFP25042.1 O-antigen chain-terminating methyltransferase [Candidatus Hakubella thermalkaliphila]GFP43064.1 O-antigen chain-terminating methyltransferase [Candidatus Hakubella thermalkaliphila]
MKVKAWHTFYREEPSLKDLLFQLQVHCDLLESILAESPRRVLEVGCGMGRLSLFLSYLGMEVTSVDNDEFVIARARRVNQQFKGRVAFVLAEAFNLPFSNHHFDVAFSQGLLEHFSNADIRKLLSEQGRVAETVILSVPNENYPNRDLGDERLLSKQEWRRILDPYVVVEDKDYFPARLPRNLFVKRKIMYLSKLRLA